MRKKILSLVTFIALITFAPLPTESVALKTNNLKSVNMEVVATVNDTRVNLGDPIRIEGYITHEESTSPVAGARVTLLNSSATTMTDSNGFFSFDLNAEQTVGNWTYVIAVETEISDDGQTSFWQADAWGNGNLSLPSLNDRSTTKQEGNDSLEIRVGEGGHNTWKIYYRYATSQDWSNQDALSFYWYGQNTGETLVIDVYAPDVHTGFYETLITENFSGWKNLVLPLDSFRANNFPSWSNVTEIGIGWLKSQGTWYLDNVNLLLLKSVSVVTDQLLAYISVEDPRINTNENATVRALAIREFDGSIFDGTLALNDTIYHQNFVGKRVYEVTRASGGRYGITKIGASETKTVIWDRVNVTLSVPNSRTGINMNGEVAAKAIYEYDNSIYDGTIVLNTSLTKDKIGKYFYSVQSVEGGRHNITSFTSNTVYIIFDSIEESHRIETQAPGKAKVTVTLRYTYDGKPVENASVKIHYPFGSVNATYTENGAYEIVLDNWSPQINIEVQKLGFPEIHVRANIGANIAVMFFLVALGISVALIAYWCKKLLSQTPW